jgi:hypothetical protein
VYGSVLSGWFGLDELGRDTILDGSFSTLPIVRGGQSVANETDQAPAAFSLDGNYPNPFQHTTTIQFTLNRSAQVKLELFDVTGRRVRTVVDQQMVAGKQEARLNGSDLPAGTYYYRLVADGIMKSGSVVKI